MKKLYWKKVLVFGLLAGLSLSGLTACGQEKAVNSSKSGTDGVRVVKIAHPQAYPPYDFVDGDGASDGYEVAVLKAIDELLPQYEFQFVGTSQDDVLIGVESGKYDLGVKGVWWTAARSETYVFPEHYIGSSTIGITIRSEDVQKVTNLEEFAEYSGKLVPIAPQNAQYNVVENYNKNHPDKQINLIAADQFDNADAYQWVLEGRYDAYFDIRTTFEANVVSESGEYHQYEDQLSYVIYEAIPTWPLFNINNQELADAYDKAWEELDTNGTLEELAQQYFGYSLFEYVPEGYQKGDEL
ncbi:MAG: transporter substrate-binding domain-containing protein [Acetatifactor sp.]|nr:transporter substrate-binding domain-containing protein [Acetatifactor sp.]